MSGLSWPWIGLMLALPPILAVAIASPFWRLHQMILGNIAGAAGIFGSAFVLILREYAEVDRMTQACIEAGYVCWPEPSAFARYAIFAFIALAEVCALFIASLYVERRIRDRRYAPEWR